MFILHVYCEFLVDLMQTSQVGLRFFIIIRLQIVPGGMLSACIRQPPTSVILLLIQFICCLIQNVSRQLTYIIKNNHQVYNNSTLPPKKTHRKHDDSILSNAWDKRHILIWHRKDVSVGECIS